MNEKQKYYKVSEKELKEFIMAAARLEALEAGGVDNWDWCYESKQDYLNDYFSVNEPDWFEDNIPSFDMIADIEINSFEEV